MSTYTYREFLTAAEAAPADSPVSGTVPIGTLVGRIVLETKAEEFQGHLENPRLQPNLGQQAMVMVPGTPSISYEVHEAFMCENCDELHLILFPASFGDGLAHLARYGPGVPARIVTPEDREAADVAPGTSEARPANPTTHSMEKMFGRQAEPSEFPDIPEDFDLGGVPEGRTGNSA